MTARMPWQLKAAMTLRSSFTPVCSGLLQRKCVCGGTPGPTGECEECRKKRLQRKTRNSELGGRNDSLAPPIVHEVLRSPGKPLDAEIRDFMESRFGHDFSEVRVHTDAKAAESARAVNGLAYTVGREVVFSVGQYAPQTLQGQKMIAHELAHVVQQSSRFDNQPLTVDPGRDAQESAARSMESMMAAEQPSSARPPLGTDCKGPTLRRISFGSDGPIRPSRRSIITTAAAIAERLVTGGGGLYKFKTKWEDFWSKGPGASMSPKPSLEQYQTALKNRILHDMDTSSDQEVRQVVEEEKTMPLERQTAAVTKVNSQDTYIRGFAIDQGIDSVVSLLLHESMHGAGIGMGPGMLFEPFMHGFEGDVGFPLMMGGAEITSISQTRRGDTDVDVTFTYSLHRIGKEDLSTQIEIQIVSPELGEIVFDEQPDGSRKPARQVIPSRPGKGQWVWHARNPGWAPYHVRLRDMTAVALLASDQFTPKPRCVIGVSTMHCEGE